MVAKGTHLQHESAAAGRDLHAAVERRRHKQVGGLHLGGDPEGRRVAPQLEAWGEGGGMREIGHECKGVTGRCSAAAGSRLCAEPRRKQASSLGAAAMRMHRCRKLCIQSFMALCTQQSMSPPCPPPSRRPPLLLTSCSVLISPSGVALSRVAVPMILWCAHGTCDASSRFSSSVGYLGCEWARGVSLGLLAST